MLIPTELFGEAYERIARIHKRTRQVVASAKVANQELGDEAAVQTVARQGNELLAELKALQDWVATVEAALETLDGRGLHRATLATLKEKEARLKTLIEQKEAYEVQHHERQRT